MMQHRGKIALVLLGFAIVSSLAVPGLPGALVASMFMIMALALYTIPNPTHRQEGSGRTDPQAKRIADTMMGIGLGLIGSIVFIFLPRDLSWLLIGVVAVTAVIYWIRLKK
jgi:hypothetical protein